MSTLRSSQALALIAAAGLAGSFAPVPEAGFLPSPNRRDNNRGIGNGNAHLPRDIQYTDSGEAVSKRRKRRLRGKAKS